MRTILAEFRSFAVRGNVVDMAVGIVLGTAFAAITSSLVTDVLMPPLGLVLSEADFSDLFVVLKEGTTPGPYLTLADAREAGAVTLDYGLFFGAVAKFVIVACAMFLLVRTVNRLRRNEPEPAPAPSTRECPHCVTTIPLRATRCPACTSDLAPA